MTFFRNKPIRERKSEKWVNHRVLAPKDTNRKGLKKVSKKGIFWLFVSAVLTKFFLKLGVEKVCQVCFGKNHCGPLDPAHARRRQDIQVGDWWWALRVLPTGRNCHFAIDRRGRRRAEPIIERFIRQMLKRHGLTEVMVKELLIECAEEVKQAELKLPESARRFQGFNVAFPAVEAPYSIDENEGVWND